MSVGVVGRQLFTYSLYTLIGLNPGAAKLFVNNLTPNRDTLTGAFTEASYPGYTAQVFSPTSISPDVNQQTIGNQVVTFPAPTSGSPVSVYGWWVEYTVSIFGLNMILAARFDSAPITLTVGGPALVLVIDLNALDFNSP